jgi:hypothetical protein
LKLLHIFAVERGTQALQGFSVRLKWEEMARKKKIKRFRAVTAVKEMARERIGTPPPTQVVPDRKKRKKEKHKPTLGRLLNPD